MLIRTADWLKKTESRDKVCKLLEYSCRLVLGVISSEGATALRLGAVREGASDSRRIFRLFRSAALYKELIGILFDDNEDLAKVLQLCAKLGFIWFCLLDNLAIAAKAKILNPKYNKTLTRLANSLWMLALILTLISHIVILNFRRRVSATERLSLKMTSARYSLDMIASLKDSKFIPLPESVVGMAGFLSALISNYLLY